MLGGRISSGATLSGLPLAAALWAASAGHCWLVTLGLVLVALILAGTIAPWAPLLHRLPPPFGAPKVKITFRQIPKNAHRYPGEVLEVGLRPTTRLEDAVLNFQFPREGLGHVGVRSLNAETERLASNIQPPSDFDSVSPILWWAASDDLRAASSMLWFQFVPQDSSREQRFKVTMVVASEKLHGDEATADYEVRCGPEGDAA